MWSVASREDNNFGEVEGCDFIFQCFLLFADLNRGGKSIRISYFTKSMDTSVQKILGKQ